MLLSWILTHLEVFKRTYLLSERDTHTARTIGFFTMIGFISLHLYRVFSHPEYNPREHLRVQRTNRIRALHRRRRRLERRLEALQEEQNEIVITTSLSTTAYRSYLAFNELCFQTEYKIEPPEEIASLTNRVMTLAVVHPSFPAYAYDLGELFTLLRTPHLNATIRHPHAGVNVNIPEFEKHTPTQNRIALFLEVFATYSDAPEFKNVNVEKKPAIYTQDVLPLYEKSSRPHTYLSSRLDNRLTRRLLFFVNTDMEEKKKELDQAAKGWVVPYIPPR